MQSAPAAAAGWNNYTFTVVLCTKCRHLLVFCSAFSSPQILHLKESDGKMGCINVVYNAVVLIGFNRTVRGHRNRFISQKCVGWAHHNTVCCGNFGLFLHLQIWLKWNQQLVLADHVHAASVVEVSRHSSPHWTRWVVHQLGDTATTARVSH